MTNPPSLISAGKRHAIRATLLTVGLLMACLALLALGAGFVGVAASFGMMVVSLPLIVIAGAAVVCLVLLPLALRRIAHPSLMFRAIEGTREERDAKLAEVEAELSHETTQRFALSTGEALISKRWFALLDRKNLVLVQRSHLRAARVKNRPRMSMVRPDRTDAVVELLGKMDPLELAIRDADTESCATILDALGLPAPLPDATHL